MINLNRAVVARRSAIAIGVVLTCSLVRFGCSKYGEPLFSGVYTEATESDMSGADPAAARAKPAAGPEPVKDTALLRSGQPIAKRVRSVQTEAEILEVVIRAQEQRIESIVPGSDGKQKLMRNGAVVFEGYALGDGSVSSGGAVVLAAHDSKLKPAARAEEDTDFKNGRWQVGISEVWLVQNGQPEKISRSGVHAENPCISPDGTRIAYTSQPLDGTGLPGRLSLSLYDTRTKRTATVPIASRGRVVPLLWEDETLAVYNGGWESMGRAEVAFLKINL